MSALMMICLMITSLKCQKELKFFQYNVLDPILQTNLNHKKLSENDYNVRYDHILKMISSVKPDIITLQEANSVIQSHLTKWINSFYRMQMIAMSLGDNSQTFAPQLIFYKEKKEKMNEVLDFLLQALPTYEFILKEEKIGKLKFWKKTFLSKYLDIVCDLYHQLATPNSDYFSLEKLDITNLYKNKVKILKGLIMNLYEK